MLLQATVSVGIRYAAMQKLVQLSRSVNLVHTKGRGQLTAQKARGARHSSLEKWIQERETKRNYTQVCQKDLFPKLGTATSYSHLGYL